MAKKKTTLKGTEDLLKNLNKFVKETKQKSFKGLIECAIMVRHSTERGNPITPLEFGDLRASWFVTTATQTIHPKVGDTSAVGEAKAEVSGYSYPTMVMGYCVNYASFVHEMGDNTNWSRPGSGKKWFEYAIKNNEKEMLEILKNNVKID